jgi:hypothetical protein
MCIRPQLSSEVSIADSDCRQACLKLADRTGMHGQSMSGSLRNNAVARNSSVVIPIVRLNNCKGTLTSFVRVIKHMMRMLIARYSDHE